MLLKIQKYSKNKKKLQKNRAKVKLALRYTDILIKNLQGFCDFVKIRSDLLNANSNYKPRTNVFDELLIIAGKEEMK